MKQPELGRKILELRKQKGFTQEELVEQCNINVRTIQRIEAGEVTPRSFTLKTILNVLGEDLENLKEVNSLDSENFNFNEIGHSSFYIKLAWISGIIYFLSGFVEFAVDYARFYEDELIISKGAYISMKFIVLIAYIYFIWGFVLSGKIFNNYLLKIGAFFLIGTGILFYGYDMVSLYTEPFFMEYVLVTQSIFCGIGSFIFGFALLRLVKPMGNISQIAGGFEIASGVFFILVFIAWLGLIFLIPAVILQIILLYKIGEVVKNERDSRLHGN
ncbi:putative transcriptional regulator [Aequorivita sublithincola DSM 14238]|uniref:Putative transcriptional regulator n=1 Tax=Aequorivita sublithincola (strain DSM 14238 / LMG 21431 / ACAM 643 / 9-3) TaxID=746697 RepID=I3YUH8_AEQSU|nr:helix-turn-helix transcriptional regulator [Aequorivita sublithincola]AFL80646.1 putative transcriptional regulator [Aequorivita sublithincola DSM 14238]